MKRLIALTIALLITACSTAPQTPAQAVFAADSTYLVALQAAVAYKKLPPCEQPAAPTLCSSAAVVAKLQQADDTAYAALSEAQTLVRSTAPADKVAAAVQIATEAVKVFAAIAQGVSK